MTHPFQSSPERAKTRVVMSLAGFVLAGILLYFSVRGIQWVRVWQIVRAARYSLLAVCCVMSSAALLLRAFRWRVLLGTEGQIGLGTVFWASAAGYLANNFLPARAGELVRAWMISSRSGLSKSFVLTTALSERVADAIALALIGAAALLVLPAQTGWLGTVSKPFTVVALCGLAAMAVLPRLGRHGKALLEWIPISGSVRTKLAGMLDQILLGARALHQPRRLASFLTLTAAIWCTDAVTVVMGGRALGLVIPLPVAFLLLAGLGLGSALPSTPGYVGIYQFVAVSILVPFGLDRTDAIAYILFSQGFYWALIACWGALAFWRFRKIASPGNLEVIQGTSPLASAASVIDR